MSILYELIYLSYQKVFIICVDPLLQLNVLCIKINKTNLSPQENCSHINMLLRVLILFPFMPMFRIM